MTNTESSRSTGREYSRRTVILAGPSVIAVVALLVLPTLVGAGVACIALLAGLAQARVSGSDRASGVAGDVYALEAQLNYCRRRDEAADLVVIDAERSAGMDVTAIAGALRCTDAVAVLLDGKRVRVAAALHRHQLDRNGLEQRLAAELRAPLRIGWASFPEDGWTVDTLTDHAMGMIEGEHQTNRVGRLALAAGKRLGVPGEGNAIGGGALGGDATPAVTRGEGAMA